MQRFHLLIFLFLAGSCAAQVLPEPPKQKWPEWLHREGLVMAGNWESLSYRIRAGALEGPNEDSSAGVAEFERAYTEETAQKLKSLGFNFVMIPLQKGFGFRAERRQLELSRKFADICHHLGMHVGLYIGGTMFSETLLDEFPDADDWCVREPDGRFSFYSWGGGRMYYRRRLNQDHPGVRARLREIVRVGIEELKADLIHLDNFGAAPGYEPYSVQRFREFLGQKYTPEERERRFGFSSVEHIAPPLAPATGSSIPATDWVRDPLLRDFIDYRAAMLASAYRDVSDYAHCLKPDILMECNVGGSYRNYDATVLPSRDLHRILPSGSAFWDEGPPTGMKDGVLFSRFRSHMLGRQYGDLVFQYTSHPVGIAEALALGLQTAGCAAHFENGDIATEQAPSGGRPLPPAIFDYIRFFNAHQDLYRDAESIADVGVLNTFEDFYFSPIIARRRAATVEQSLYQGKIPFTIVPAPYPGDLSRFRVIVAADMYYLPPVIVQALRQFVTKGGGLVLTGRAKEFADLFSSAPANAPLRGQIGKGRIAYLPEISQPEKFGQTAANHDEILAAIRWAAGADLSVKVEAPLTTTMAFYRQAGGRRLLHLVNYDDTRPAENIVVTLDKPAHSAVLQSPDDGSSTSLPLETDGERTSFRVSKLKTYAIVTIDE